MIEAEAGAAIYRRTRTPRPHMGAGAEGPRQPEKTNGPRTHMAHISTLPSSECLPLIDRSSAACWPRLSSPCRSRSCIS